MFDPHNRRRRTPRNLGMIVDGLKTVGAARSIVIDELNQVLAGNGVLEAAAAAGTKPSFIPLTMAEVRAAPSSGLTHVSTFSGAGGTCLGFKLAGFRTLWANDIEGHARECYRLNLENPIDGRDISRVTSADILTAIGLKAGELDVFEGSPPCTAFSIAGKRAKGWKQTKEHAGQVQTNIEDLFFEWLRLLEGLRPRAFVAENVAGLVKGVSKGYFKEILRRMKALGYRTEAQLLDAQWLGVPQTRVRVIFMGLRDDLGLVPAFPKPWAFRYSVRDALPWVRAVKQEVFRTDKRETAVNSPCPTITTGALGASRQSQYWVEVNPRVVYDNGGAVRNLVVTDRPCPTVTVGRGRSDLAIASAHFLVEGEAKADPVTQTKRKGRDPNTTRRKFTIAELKRICSFPDDYAMVGTYSQQWARLGNSVPPLMAKAIADSVRGVLLGGRS